jgi:hypothetical protein
MGSPSTTPSTPTTEGPPLTSAGHTARSRRVWRRRLLALGVVAGLFGGGFYAATHLLGGVGPTLCEATSGSTQFALDVDQTGNAALISAVAEKRGLPARAVTIALATALQESKLRNIEHGDLDSVGLFQQRPSQGWGSAAQILDPVYATNAFFDALVKIDGYQSMDITKAAQKVQRSAYPTAYAKHEALARVFASALTGLSEAGLACRLDDPADGAGSAARAGEELSALMGVRAVATADSLRVTVADSRRAWTVGAWAVGRADLTGATSVRVADRVWTRGKGEDATTWQHVDEQLPKGQVLVSFAR